MAEAQMMRSVVRVTPRHVRVVDLPRPQLEAGTAVVRVRAAGICGSDLHGYRERDQPEARPQGHEVAGEVVGLAPHPGSQPAVREGDLVALDTICLGRACGACRWCREGVYFHCERKRRGDDWAGGFAEYIKRDVRGLFPLPAGIGPAEGAMVEPLAVAVHAVRLAQLQRGETVAIIGAGTIGLMCVMAAAAMGAGAVYAMARHPHQAELARALGASDALLGAPEEAAVAVRERTGGLGADLAIETVGGEAPTLNQAWSLVRRRGRVAVLGVFGHQVPVNLGAPLGKEVTVCFPVCYGDQDGRHDYDVAIDLIASRKAPVTKLLTHRFALEEAAAAFAAADDKSSRSIKVQFHMDR
ncbi:MAG: zinc-binding dehydrogenase [Chloroflexi bacterium]|nr:zinc-binding dehydrogenase [Chloroflexota bacterium]